MDFFLADIRLLILSARKAQNAPNKRNRRELRMGYACMDKIESMLIDKTIAATPSRCFIKYRDKEQRQK